MPYDRNVFVNCPFDKEYVSLLRPLLFTVLYLGLKPRIALERNDSGESRLDKIVELIRDSKYSIHDLSRSEANAAGELYRLNMPFELGIDYGCRLFGRSTHRAKATLVLESKPHRYKAAISDLSGADIECHYNEPYRIFSVVRHWLKNVCVATAPGPAQIEAAFTQFMTDDYEALVQEGFSARDIEGLPIGELIERMSSWLTRSALSHR